MEERNFLARKNLLDYDEVMDYQRTTFYGLRQKVLRGMDVDQVIWRMIGDAIDDAVRKYVEEDYVAAVISEWSRINFEVSIDARDLKGIRHLEDLEQYIKRQARNEAENSIGVTLDEFMGEDPDNPENWDTRGLSSWAMSRFHVNLSQAQIRKMDAKELKDTLTEAAIVQIEQRDVSGLQKFIEPLFAESELANWAREKFGIQIDPNELLADERNNQRKSPADIIELIEQRARAAYARREIEYPVDHVLAYTLTTGQDGQIDNPYAAEEIQRWAKQKFGIELSLDRIAGQSIKKLREELIGMQEKYLLDGKVAEEVDKLMAANPTPGALVKAVNKRFEASITEADLEERAVVVDAKGVRREEADNGEERLGTREKIARVGRQFMRKELTDLEQFVLIQIFDQSWKDHLYAMDILKSGVGLMGFAEKDPRIVYKKEGFDYFQQMMRGIRDKVTDLIFRAGLSARRSSAATIARRRPCMSKLRGME